MKMNPEVLKQIAKDYAKKKDVNKKKFTSIYTAFIILNSTDEMTKAHDSEDIPVLAKFLLELDVGSEEELRKKRWGKYTKVTVIQHVAVSNILQTNPRKPRENYWDK